jgi:hypothetical protein
MGTAKDMSHVDKPWATDLEALALRFPQVPRGHVALALDSYWPDLERAEAMVVHLAAKYDDPSDATITLDFTPAPAEVRAPLG